MNEEDLRDCFAMFAINGMLSVKDWFGNSGTWASASEMQKTYAEEAYGFADAMLEARKKVETDDEGGIATVAKRTYKRKTK